MVNVHAFSDMSCDRFVPTDLSKLWFHMALSHLAHEVFCQMNIHHNQQNFVKTRVAG